MNAFTLLFLVFLIAGIMVQWILVNRHLRHIRSNREQVPIDFSDKISLEEHQKAADYTAAKVKVGLAGLVIDSIFLLIWLLAGGLQLLDNIWKTFNLPEIITGTGFILSVVFIQAILALPLSVYGIFKIEESFGFNKMTPKIFCVDLMKNAVVNFIINTPIIVLVLWFMANSGALWWIYAWIVLVLFMFVYIWAYPTFIASWFNKFIPLDNPELQKRITALLDKNGFESRGIFVVNGSLRSTHGNAYFTGFGKNKRIVFFDTLMEILNYDEIEAVLAHELGHFKRHHVKKLPLFQAVLYLIGLAVLGWLIDQNWFYHGLGVSGTSDYMALTLFLLVAPVFAFFVAPLFKMITRKYEFEADDFATNQTRTENLITALVNLYRRNANTLTPDPLYSAFHDSHPPAPIRIAHLKTKLARGTH